MCYSVDEIFDLRRLQAERNDLLDAALVVGHDDGRAWALGAPYVGVAAYGAIAERELARGELEAELRLLDARYGATRFLAHVEAGRLPDDLEAEQIYLDRFLDGAAEVWATVCDDCEEDD